MKRLTIEIAEESYESLRIVAKKERRTAAGQAAIIVEQAVENLLDMDLDLQSQRLQRVEENAAAAD